MTYVLYPFWLSVGGWLSNVVVLHGLAGGRSSQKARLD